MINFLIVSCGYRCEDTIQRCIESVDGQSYGKWFHIVKIDGYGKASLDLAKSNRVIQHKKLRVGKMQNFYYAMDNCLVAKPIWPVSHNHLIIIDLDADDYLEPNALEVLAKIYQDPNIWATHGSYRMLSGRPARFNGEYKNDNFRGSRWRASHLKSFRAPLFYKIKLRDFKNRANQWLMTSSDMAIMFPVMELAGLDRIRYVPDIIYNYNDLSELNDHKVAPADQKRNEKQLRRKPAYKRLEKL